MRVLFALLFAAIVVFGSGCGNSSTPKSEPKAPKGPVTSKLNAEGTQKLMAVMTAYYGLKNALVATNAAQTTAANKQLLSSAEAMQAFLQTDSINKVVLQPYMDTIVTQSKVIEAESDPKCERQRLAFSPLSDNVFALLKHVDIKNAGVYKQFCPMAFNDKGAYWLSEESEIKNPYFGKKMLECGEVQDSL